MEKPKNQILQRVAKLLDERNVEYEVETSYDRLFMTEKMFVKGPEGEYIAILRPRNEGVHVTISKTPVEGAVIAICGPDRRLEDEYPTARKHMSFANVSMNLETDRRDVLMPVKKAEMLKDHMDRLGHKVKNQQGELRRLHLKCMRQQDEIMRMEDNALRMAVLYMGYSEGES